jgi:hypothetical protein
VGVFAYNIKTGGKQAMVASLMASAITLKKCTAEKVAFIILNVIDLLLTLLAVSHGARELNPLMNQIIGSPNQLILVKLIIPLFLAWLIPGKLLIPAIALLTFVVGWNIRELIIILG